MSSVSVIIPCYKYGHFLSDSVRSALDHQPDVDVRVLIIDNASPDDSADVARALSANDKRIELIVHENNVGHVASINEGLAWADGDYVVVLAADDMLTPGALTRATTLMDANPSVGFCYGRPIHFNYPGPRPAARTGKWSQTIWPGSWWLRRRFREGQGCISSPEVVMRTSVQREVGGYDPVVPNVCDLLMWMRLAAHSDVGYIKGADQAYFRRHGSNMSNRGSFSELDEFRELKLAYESVVTGSRDVLPKSGVDLDEMVHRRLARMAIHRVVRAYDRGRIDETPVDELMKFAEECWPDCKRLPEYLGLRVRQRIGPRLMPYMQPFILSAVVAKGRSWLWWQSWQRRGI